MKIKIPRMGNKGNIMVNLMHLVLFYVVYFALVLAARYVVGVLEVTEPLSDYWSDIPSSTIQLMDLIIFVIVPVAALIWTITASRPQPEYVR